MERAPRWQPTGRQKLVGGIVLVVVLLVIAGYSAEWTGFPGQTLWDWLQLLIVPAVIAAGGVWFNRRQRERDQQSAELQRERERVAEEARWERELEVENQRAQGEALQAYLDRMERLIVDKGLREERDKNELSPVARAHTLVLLDGLGPNRKRRVVRFLYEAGLIYREGLVVGLGGANLRNANLSGISLCNLQFSGADLLRAHEKGVDPHELAKPISSANLSGADLTGAKLTGAVLGGIELSFAKLNSADLTGADLRNANLHRVRGVTRDQLATCKTLREATMPNGQKYEDWLKDRENNGGS